MSSPSPAAANTIACTQCGGENPLASGQPAVPLPVLRRHPVRRSRRASSTTTDCRALLGADEARAALRRWMAGNETVKDLDKKSSISALDRGLLPDVAVPRPPRRARGGLRRAGRADTDSAARRSQGAGGQARALRRRGRRGRGARRHHPAGDRARLARSARRRRARGDGAGPGAAVALRLQLRRPRLPGAGRRLDRRGAGLGLPGEGREPLCPGGRSGADPVRHRGSSPSPIRSSSCWSSASPRCRCCCSPGG